MIEEITIFFQIILIDLVLAGDNAIIIGMVASQFDKNLRKKIIFWGIGAAIVLRIALTSIATYLLQIDGLRTIGGLLLLYISYIFYRDVIKKRISDKKKIESFIVLPGMGINYKAGIWHFPLISTENMNFLVVDRKGDGNNLIIHNFEKEKIILEY